MLQDFVSGPTSGSGAPNLARALNNMASSKIKSTNKKKAQLMFKTALACIYHTGTVFIAGHNGLVIVHRAARLDDGFYSLS